jgi:cytochrome c553
VTTRSRLWGLVGLLSCLLLAAPVTAQPRHDDVAAIKAVTCAACHGAAGNSRSDTMPILAGMDPAYFKKQIQDYARGLRPSPEMEPYAKQVLALGVDDIAAFFARQRMARTPVRVDPVAVARGRDAAASCAACHGADGKGDRARLVPALAGQPPGYLREQLRLLKQDRRNPGDAALAVVKAVMKSLPDERLADLAAYYSSLTP